MDALRRSDAEAYTELHAAYLEGCQAPQSRDAYAYLFEVELAAGVPDDPELRIVRVDPEEHRQQLAMLSAASGQEVRYPATPSLVIELTTTDGYPAGHPCHSGATRRVLKHVAETDGSWVLAPPCLPESMLEELRRRRRASLAVSRMQDELSAELTPDLRARLLERIRSGRLGEAVALYREATRSSGGAAARLVERLCKEL